MFISKNRAQKAELCDCLQGFQICEVQDQEWVLGSYQQFVKTKKYGKARQFLPIQIAQPFVEVAEKLNVYPWLDYHYAYSLGNYKFIDESKGFHWSNLDQCV